MPAADTNVLVRLLVDDDVEQQRHAASFVRRSGSVFVSHLVVMETSWVLARVYRFARTALALALEMLLSTEGLVVERSDIVEEAIRTFRASTADFTDCLVLAVARAANELPLATFDERLGRVPGAHRLGRKRRPPRRAR